MAADAITVARSGRRQRRSFAKPALINKARRGELRCRMPIGFVYDGEHRAVLDPDTQVQQSVRLLFHTFDPRRLVVGFQRVRRREMHDVERHLRDLRDGDGAVHALSASVRVGRVFG